MLRPRPRSCDLQRGAGAHRRVRLARHRGSHARGRRERPFTAAAAARSAAADEGARTGRRDPHDVVHRQPGDSWDRGLRIEQGLSARAGGEPVVRAQGPGHRRAGLHLRCGPHTRVLLSGRQGRPGHSRRRRGGRAGFAGPRPRARGHARVRQPAGHGVHDQAPTSSHGHRHPGSVDARPRTSPRHQG